MRRNTLNFLVDIVSLVVMFGMIATGLVIRFVLPPGTGGRHGGAHKVLCGLGRHDWGDIHFWLAVAIGVLLLVHVALHWAWVCGIVQRLVRRGEPGGTKATAWTRNLYGSGFLIATVAAFAAFLWIAWASAVTLPGGAGNEHQTPPRKVHEVEGDDQEEHEGLHAGYRPDNGWGSATLAEVEADTGVPVAVIREGLELPDTVSEKERLGRLRQRYGFEMSAVRAIIEKHRNQAGAAPVEQ